MGVLGVDPGSRGALCFLEDGKATFMDYAKHPPHIIYQGICSLDIDLAIVEDVHSIFGTSAKSNFNFGKNVGIIHGLLWAKGCGFELVTPKVWQKAVGVRAKGKAIKKDVADICTRLYPAANIKGPKGGLLDGRSDALMIAHYGSLLRKI
jgi:hypothetical protein